MIVDDPRAGQSNLAGVFCRCARRRQSGGRFFKLNGAVSPSGLIFYQSDINRFCKVNPVDRFLIACSLPI
jgi:hypothetical protein